MRNRLISSVVRLIERESSLVGGSASKVAQAKTLHSCVGTSLVSKLSGLNFESNRSNGNIPGRSLVSAGRAFSTSAWDNILYPETELQVGSPAPDFSLEGMVFMFGKKARSRCTDFGIFCVQLLLMGR